MKKYLAILLMLVYTAVSAVAVYAQVMPKTGNEQELTLKGYEEHRVEAPVNLQKKSVQRTAARQTRLCDNTLNILQSPYKTHVYRASQPPAYIWHCAYIL
jgi:hypothetical protein